MSESEHPKSRISIAVVVAVVASIGCVVLTALLVVTMIGATAQHQLAMKERLRAEEARAVAEQAMAEALRQRALAEERAKRARLELLEKP